MRHEVQEMDTASAIGSGDVPVLATPRLVAWFEAATVEVAAPYVGAEETSVGTTIRIDHTKGSAVGTELEVSAAADPPVDGRRITFSVKAIDGSGELVGGGEIVRVLVDRERFIGSLRSWPGRGQ